MRISPLHSSKIHGHRPNCKSQPHIHTHTHPLSHARTLKPHVWELLAWQFKIHYPVHFNQPHHGTGRLQLLPEAKSVESSNNNMQSWDLVDSETLPLLFSVFFLWFTWTLKTILLINTHWNEFSHLESGFRSTTGTKKSALKWEKCTRPGQIKGTGKYLQVVSNDNELLIYDCFYLQRQLIVGCFIYSQLNASYAVDNISSDGLIKVLFYQNKKEIEV